MSPYHVTVPPYFQVTMLYHRCRTTLPYPQCFAHHATPHHTGERFLKKGPHGGNTVFWFWQGTRCSRQEATTKEKPSTVVRRTAKTRARTKKHTHNDSYLVRWWIYKINKAQHLLKSKTDKTYIQLTIAMIYIIQYLKKNEHTNTNY